MSQPSSKLEITERLIDFGMHSVQLSQIASVRLRKKSLVWTVFGVLCLFLGALLLIFAGMAIFKIVMGDGNNQSLNLLTLIPALFLLIIGRNLVFGMHSAVIIAASDGSKVQVPGGSDELLEAVYQRIKQAIGAGGEPFHVSVDLVSEKIVPRTGSTAIARSSEITVDHDTASAKGSVGTASTTADASFDFEPAGAATDTSLGEAGYVNG